MGEIFAFFSQQPRPWNALFFQKSAYATGRKETWLYWLWTEDMIVMIVGFWLSRAERGNRPGRWGTIHPFWNKQKSVQFMRFSSTDIGLVFLHWETTAANLNHSCKFCYQQTWTLIIFLLNFICTLRHYLIPMMNRPTWIHTEIYPNTHFLWMIVSFD